MTFCSAMSFNEEDVEEDGASWSTVTDVTTLAKFFFISSPVGGRILMAIVMLSAIFLGPASFDSASVAMALVSNDHGLVSGRAPICAFKFCARWRLMLACKSLERGSFVLSKRLFFRRKSPL